jgi:hypothetical protein
MGSWNKDGLRPFLSLFLSLSPSKEQTKAIKNQLFIGNNID